uniref:NCCRP1, F-box associated domain containing n=1 Tax=Salvator merianae TaxID=96440 RepID=A0A8D0DSU8_SALMN
MPKRRGLAARASQGRGHHAAGPARVFKRCKAPAGIWLPPVRSMASPPPPPAWQQRLEARWGLARRGVPLPKEEPIGSALLDPKPFERNLLQNPNPEGRRGVYTGPGAWRLTWASLGLAGSGFTCPSALPSWCVKQQWIDLLAEGLWEEMLDFYQPNITVMDWYENSGLASSVYELHARLLGSNKAKVITVFPRDVNSPALATPVLLQVSHVFGHYGPGVRHVHFLHKTKDVETPAGFLRTRATDSSVSVQLRD